MLRVADRHARTPTIVFSGVGRRGAARAGGRDGGVRPARPDRRAAPGVRARQHAAGHRRPALAADGGRQQRPARRSGASRSTRRSRPSVRGGGAGTYRLAWERDRPAPPAQRRRRPLALLTRCGRELGWIGIVLLADRLRGPARGGRRAPAGARAPRARAPSSRPATALLLHAMVDWDWEMPALFIWFFGAAGAVIAAPAEAAASAPRAAAADAPASPGWRSCSSR